MNEQKEAMKEWNECRMNSMIEVVKLAWNEVVAARLMNCLNQWPERIDYPLADGMNN